MHNHILIAYDDMGNNMFEETAVPTEQQTVAMDSAIPALPQVPAELPSEAEFVVGKSLISFGVMFIGIILLVIILLVVKKHMKGNLQSQNGISEEEYSATEQKKTIKQNKTEDSKPEQDVQQVKKTRRQKGEKLNTPATIQQCILKFLEKTK